MSQRILVTGAGGFAGSHLVEHLRVSSPATIVAWTRQDVDILDRHRLRSALRDVRPSQIYHCAGIAHVADSWHETAKPLESNVMGTEYLFDALRREQIRCRVLIPGSATVYGPSAAPIAEDAAIAPASPYAISKLAQEQLAVRAVEEDGLDVLVTRSFNHTGPRQTPAYVAPSMAKQIALIERGAIEPVIKVGNLEARRDLSDVRDVVRAYVALMEKGTAGIIYNVGSGVARSIQSILDALVARAKVPVRVEIDQARLRPNDVPVIVANCSRLVAATGWRPTVPFDQMLDDLLGYWRSVGVADAVRS